MERWGHHKGPVYLYGDATGGSRGSAKVQGTDWDLIKTELRTLNPISRVPTHNPPERERVNCVNSRLRTSDGVSHVVVDAPDVARDLDETIVLDGGAGEIDKNADRSLTHHSDAFGYYCVSQHSIRGTGLYISQEM
jgi:hypothetical protein